VRTRHPWLQFWRGLVLGAFTLFFFSALERLPQAEATAINFIAPLIVMLLAGRLLGETVTRTRWIGAALGFVGMLILVRPGSALDPLGVVFVLLTVCCNVAFQILTRRLATADDSFATMFLSALMGVAMAALLLPWQDEWGGWPRLLDASQWLMLASLGVLGGISQWCLIRAYVWSSASFLAPLLYLQLMWSTLAGWLFFAQLPALASLGGMLLILAGGVGTMLFESRRPAKLGSE
jgi:drug/metabolite transporter (DMT)-like permease